MIGLSGTRLRRTGRCHRIWLISYEGGRKAGDLTQHGDDRYPAHFQTGERIAAGGNQLRHCSGYCEQKGRVCLEAVFVKVCVADLAGTEREVPRELGAIAIRRARFSIQRVLFAPIVAVVQHDY